MYMVYIPHFGSLSCYRIYIACILFISMRYTFGMLLLKHPVILKKYFQF